MKEKRIRSFLRIAKSIGKDSSCYRKKFGAILVKDSIIISTGYNGAIRGAYNCGEDILCIKDLRGEASYLSYLHCPAIHAEHNACLHAGRPLAQGSTMFLAKANGDGMSGRPCMWCRRVMVQCGIKDMYYYDYEGNIVHEMVDTWVEIENKWMEEELNWRPSDEN